MLIESFKEAQQSYHYLKHQKFNNYIGHDKSHVLLTMYLSIEEKFIGIGWRWKDEEKPNFLLEVELNMPQLTEEIYNSSIHKLLLDYKKFQNDKELKSLQNDF